MFDADEDADDDNDDDIEDRSIRDLSGKFPFA